jgi:bacterioferritin
MQGKKSIIDSLNKLLSLELTAADQYFVHSRMYENWGLKKLYERISHERDDELKHADVLIRRILFLEGTPDVAKRGKLDIGVDVPSALKSDLAYEYGVIKDLRSSIALCEKEKDFETRHLLQDLLDETEEDHTYWLEQQVRLIELMGLQNYLQTATGDISVASSS